MLLNASRGMSAYGSEQNNVKDGMMSPLVAGADPVELSFWAKGTAGTTGDLKVRMAYVDGIGNIKWDSGFQSFSGGINENTWTKSGLMGPKVGEADLAVFVQFNLGIGPVDPPNLTAGRVFIDNVSVQAIPEPGTYALMLAGLAGVGLLAKRRRQAESPLRACPGALRRPFLYPSPARHDPADPLPAEHTRRSASAVEQAPLPPAQGDAGLPRIWVDPSRRFQAIEGFGGAFTEAAAVTWLALDAERQQAFLRDCFDPMHGHGYTLCRVHMNSCDFSLGNYSHVETSGDVALHSFSIERDRRALLPFIRAAQQAAGRPLQLLASPWSPPAWMKSNGQMNHGGRLLPDYRAAWAHCFVRFIRAYAAAGVPIWGVTVQNEARGHATLGLLPLHRGGRARLRARPGSRRWPQPVWRGEDLIRTTTATGWSSAPAWSMPMPKRRATCGAPVSTGTARTTSSS